ncbi:50S ribosomal protein L18 [bacterium]|jgi:large subunit ribosomal protein L18|nr:50S ribosomal protein L18 [bacterium]
MSKLNEKTRKRVKRHKKIRARVSGTKETPRLSLYKSNKRIYAQVIDDDGRTTIVSALTDTKKGKTMTQKASEAGKEIAKKAIEKKIKEVVFDRGGFLYAGKIKAFADSAREGGLKF